MAPDDRDPTVKELLAGKPLAEVDEVTARELERWFTLPSFEQVEAELDPGVAAVLAQRERATAAVDPELLSAIAARAHRDPDELLQLDPTIELHVNPELALVDHAAAERGFTIAEPREVEIPDELRDDLKECTPQALLRDLHRSELLFDKQFELVDHAPRVDAAGEVAQAMATSWRLTPPKARPLAEVVAMLGELRRVRRLPWPQLFREQPPANRRIAE